ncbi:MAG: hypothetical protein MJZ99_09810 [Bacteroidales bacterium]|nr:hypothetical protein [Bacteroidales bacterium]
MLKLFRTDIIAQALIILAVMLLMWVKYFIHPMPIPVDGGGPIFFWLTGWMTPRIGTITAFLLIIVEGLFVNMMLYRYKLISQNTLMPMLFFVLAMSLYPPTLSPMVIGTIFLIIGISQMMLTSTLLSLPIDKVFSSTALLSLATLICPYMAVFFVPLVLNMFNYSLYSWRDWAMFVMGMLAPYLLVETIYFITDELFYRNYLLLYDFTNFHFSFKGNWIEWAASASFAILFLVGLVSSIMNSQNRTVNYKNNITALMVFTIGSLLYSVYTDFVPLQSQAFALPFACSMTTLFAPPQRKEFFRNLLFMLIVAAAIILNVI